MPLLFALSSTYARDPTDALPDPADLPVPGRTVADVVGDDLRDVGHLALQVSAEVLVDLPERPDELVEPLDRRGRPRARPPRYGVVSEV
jgi:hypothetical protein